MSEVKLSGSLNFTSLRDRIAAALKAEDEKPHTCPFDGEPTMASYDRLADAVIRELRLDEAAQDCRCQLRHLWETGND